MRRMIPVRSSPDRLGRDGATETSGWAIDDCSKLSLTMSPDRPAHSRTAMLSSRHRHGATCRQAMSVMVALCRDSVAIAAIVLRASSEGQ